MIIQFRPTYLNGRRVFQWTLWSSTLLRGSGTLIAAIRGAGEHPGRSPWPRNRGPCNKIMTKNKVFLISETIWSDGYQYSSFQRYVKIIQIFYIYESWVVQWGKGITAVAEEHWPYSHHTTIQILYSLVSPLSFTNSKWLYLARK